VRLRIRARVLSILLATPGCTAKPTPSFQYVIHAESDPGQALTGVSFSTLGKTIGVTDRDGVLVASLRGASGESAELKITCPTGYRDVSDKLTLRLRELAQRDKRPEYHVRCAPVLRRLVLAVRASGIFDVPVQVLGKEIARTDHDGVAHALLELPPGEALVVKLDTSARTHATLMPHDPELRIVMPEHDEVVLFDQTFVRPPPPRRLRPKPEPVGPQPI
jgi:hypothetical protein